MMLSIACNYVGGILVAWGGERNKKIKRIVLVFFLLLNLGFLFYYKYFNFAVITLRSIIPNFYFPIKDIALPIGISFFTFQGMSYIIDVYRDEVKPQKNPLIIAMYISMFPQLIAGPIVRYSDIESACYTRQTTIDTFYSGISRFVIGLSKKMFIANTLAVQADRIFSQNVNQIGSGTAWLGAIFYALQIYYDFSGYSDMAIGLGKMIGFSFPENFDYPYISKSIREFWRRWHISLSTFFRDYVYIPLGGSRKGNVYIHLFAIFLLTGLWHGASWTFVLWGLWHGLFIILERIFLKESKSILLVNILEHVYTLFIVLIGWVLFRSETIQQAIGYIKAMFGIRSGIIAFDISYYLDYYTIFILILGIILSTNIFHTLISRIKLQIGNLMTWDILKCIGIIILFFLCAMEVMSSTYNPFIYFRF